MECWCRLSVVVMVVICTLTPVYTRRRDRSSEGMVSKAVDPVWQIRHILPNLDLENNTVRNVRVNTGEMAYLPCRFPELSTLQQVSWMRRRDWHILTTGVYTYTSDLRFKILHPQHSDDWTLMIKRVDKRDNGTYECQMYTGTGVLSQFVNLHVNTPRAAILGPRELHVQEGDNVTLVCVIHKSQPPFVFWYHGELMVNYNDRLNVMTRVENSRTHSTLTIHQARNHDSGNYSCLPPNVTPAHVLVFVSQRGDTVAAVQRRGHSSSSSSAASSPFLLSSSFFSSLCLLSLFSLFHFPFSSSSLFLPSSLFYFPSSPFSSLFLLSFSSLSSLFYFPSSSLFLLSFSFFSLSFLFYFPSSSFSSFSSSPSFLHYLSSLFLLSSSFLSCSSSLYYLRLAIWSLYSSTSTRFFPPR